jgi:hypothetical protein
VHASQVLQSLQLLRQHPVFVYTYNIHKHYYVCARLAGVASVAAAATASRDDGVVSVLLCAEGRGARRHGLGEHGIHTHDPLYVHTHDKVYICTHTHTHTVHDVLDIENP